MHFLKYTLSAALLCAGTLLFGQDDNASLFDALHASGEAVVINLETDWKKITRQRRQKVYQPGTFQIKSGDIELAAAGKVRSRGHIRLEQCSNPSLKIKLKKEALRQAGYSDLNDLKLVIQCSSSKISDSYLAREHSAYALHAVFSDYTHRTIPAKLVVAEGDTLRGFLLEAEEQLAARYDGSIVKSHRMSQNGLVRETYANLCLFNYLILNTDWAVFNLHNVEFIVPEGKLRPIAIPYDFDYSGWVATTYAVPDERLDIKSVQVPKWRGKDLKQEELVPLIDHYESRKQEAYALVETFPDLSERDRKRMTKRLDAFYKTIEDKKWVKQVCEGK